MQVMVQPDGTAIALVHWTYLDGRWRIACVPHVEPDGNWQRTGDPRAANCPYCLETARYREALAAQPKLVR